jgi:HEPN domain-containing protein
MSVEYLKEWVRKAEEDYAVANSLVARRRSPTPNAVSFHCQQCAEKYLKAFLVQHNVVFPKTHDLLELHKLCLSVAPSFAMIDDLLDLLNPYSVEFRYPGEETTVEEAKAAVRAMKKVRRFVQGLLTLSGE